MRCAQAVTLLGSMPTLFLPAVVVFTLASIGVGLSVIRNARSIPRGRPTRRTSVHSTILSSGAPDLVL